MRLDLSPPLDLPVTQSLLKRPGQSRLLPSESHLHFPRPDHDLMVYLACSRKEHRTESCAGNEELVAKLQSEITLEEEQQEDGIRGNLKEYLDSSEFKLEDVPGQEEVALSRTYGDEK